MDKSTFGYVLLFLGITFLLFTACSYHKADDPGPVNPAVSYALDVKPIIVANCYTCHTDTSTNPDKPGFAFFNHFNELQYLALKPSAANSNYTILIARLKHIESPGMPFQRDPLSDSLIQVIQNWVRLGAPEN